MSVVRKNIPRIFTDYCAVCPCEFVAIRGVRFSPLAAGWLVAVCANRGGLCLGLVDVADLDDIPVESINTIALGDNFHMPAEEVGRFQLALEYNSTSDTRSELIGIRCVQ